MSIKKILLYLIVFLLIFILILSYFGWRYKKQIIWNMLWTYIGNIIYPFREPFLATGGLNHNELYNTPGMWYATGEQMYDPDFRLNKTVPFSSSNQDIKSIFNYDNRPKENNKYDFYCNETLMRPMLYQTLKIQSFDDNSFLVFKNNELLAKKFEYPPFNLSFEWTFTPINQNFNDCLVYIVNYRNGINDMVQHYITAFNSRHCETTTFLGTREQYWKIIFANIGTQTANENMDLIDDAQTNTSQTNLICDNNLTMEQDTKDKIRNNRVYFRIQSYYYDTYLAHDINGEITLTDKNEVSTMNGKTYDRTLWYIEHKC